MRVEPSEIVTALDSISSIGSRQLVYDQVSVSYRLPPLPDFPASTKFFQDLKAVHASGATGAGVGVGIVDSGVLWEHPVLRWSRQRSINFSGTRNDSDEYGHGTLVALLIKAIVPDASFVSAKVLDEKGRCSADKLLEAMRWIGNQGVQVINLSLGVAKDGPMQDCECSLCSLANELALKGIVVCVALGNDPTKSYHPGCAKHVLTASVLGPDGFPLYIRARTKKHQPPTITVPEFLVPSLAAPYDGRTSMGCSYLAGVSALIWGIWVERQTSSTSVADLEKSGFSRQTVANFLVTKGLIAYRKGQMVAALDQYRQALEQDPDNLAARLNQGMALAQVEPPQFQAALRAFQLVLERDVANVEALIGLGHVYNQLGQDAKAVESFTRALKIEPSSAVALKNLATMALKARPPDAEKAQQLLEKAVRLDPNNPEIQHDLGVVYWQAGKLDEAKYHLKAAIRLAPDWPLPKRVLAKLEGA